MPNLVGFCALSALRTPRRNGGFLQIAMAVSHFSTAATAESGHVRIRRTEAQLHRLRSAPKAVGTARWLWAAASALGPVWQVRPGRPAFRANFAPHAGRVAVSGAHAPSVPVTTGVGAVLPQINVNRSRRWRHCLAAVPAFRG